MMGVTKRPIRVLLIIDLFLFIGPLTLLSEAILAGFEIFIVSSQPKSKDDYDYWFSEYLEQYKPINHNRKRCGI